MSLTRSSGVLLHPTSLPGPFGIGDLGPKAYTWVDLLARAGQSWWQVLPVGPTGYGDSPYQSPSTFAGNLNLVSPELLERDGLATAGDLSGCELDPPSAVDFGAVIARKRRLVHRAWERFEAGDGPAALRPAFDAFQMRHAHWLDEFALFMAIKDAHSGAPWWEWPRLLARRDAAAMRAAAETFAEEAASHRFGQFLFYRQWATLREHAATQGVRIIGDLPIYVSHDSADVWANPELFRLDVDRRPTRVAGVPPDYFSTTGQLWGNPVYDWEEHRRTGFRWWVARMRAALGQFDVVRLDHFRGLVAFWAVPYGDDTAERGEWLRAPGGEMLAAVRDALGGLPIIAEDLGFITPDVDELRERFGLPGMRILQFAFGGAVEERFLPHRFAHNVVAYTGTHDNDTAHGWADSLTAAERERFARYAPQARQDPVGALVRLAWSSVADLAIAPVQDLIGLGSDARLNAPGTTGANWRWRMADRDLTNPAWSRCLAEMTTAYERGEPAAS